MGEEMNIREELIADLTAELKISDANFNSDLLEAKVKNAIRDVVSARRYPSYYSEERILEDLWNHYSLIRRIALYDYNQVGIEGESNHTENGVQRAYTDRNKLFRGIVSFSR